MKAGVRVFVVMKGRWRVGKLAGDESFAGRRVRYEGYHVIIVLAGDSTRPEGKVKNSKCESVILGRGM